MASFEIVELDAAGKPRPFPAGVFPDGKTASSIIAELQLKYPNKKFQPRPLKDETQDWKAREQRRFDEGVYQPIGLDITPITDHFVHKALKTPANVAYTPDAKAGAIDRQTSIHIRAYINKFYPDFSIEDKRKLVWDYCGESFGDELQFARTREEIRTVYEAGPGSCMSYTADTWEGLDGLHPVEAYASPDFAIAYLKVEGRIVARTLVAPELKLYSIIYGDRDKMASALNDNGYKKYDSSQDWHGLHLLKIPVERGGYLCPYLDAFEYVKEVGDYLEVCSYSASGAMSGSDTEGYVSSYKDESDDDYY